VNTEDGQPPCGFAGARRRWLRGASALVCALLSFANVHADTVRVAVAANFSEVIEALAPEYEHATGERLRVTTGSTGKLYAQIVNGAPFDVFLAADQARPQRLEQSGLIVPGSRFTYAIGQLSLWSAAQGVIGEDGIETLRTAGFRRLAMANPALAPYGAAAQQALESLGLAQALADRIVLGENVGQAFTLIATGNAELGFVARASLVSARTGGRGSYWHVPPPLHAPIRQDGVVLSAARNVEAALHFTAWLRSDEAQARIAAFGYRRQTEDDD
jgi:molybdate transport system substrate-binding protein